MSLKDRILKIWNSKLNPLGNYDDPVPPDWCFEKYGVFAWFYWFFVRNPLHNFFWHVIGFKDKPLDYTQIWNARQKWNLVLPFFSYRGNRIEFYIGWRPDSRMFGVCFRIKKIVIFLK